MRQAEKDRRMFKAEENSLHETEVRGSSVLLRKLKCNWSDRSKGSR